VSYKVVRNSDGLVIAFGPNNEHYEPTVEASQTLSIEENQPTRSRSASEVRQNRNDRLAASDWTQMPDYSGSDKADWATYRQALRDVPSQDGFPRDITWPDEP
jgi:hypothetical protein